MTRKFEVMPIEKVEQILIKAKEHGVREVFPFLNGEPTLHPQFLDIIRLIKYYDFRCHVISNFGFIKPQDVVHLHHILRAGDSLTISMDAVTPELYKKIRGAELQPVLDNIEVLRGMSRSYILNVQCIVTKHHTQKDLDEFTQYFSSRGMNSGFGNIANWGGAIESSLPIQGDHCTRLTTDMCFFTNGDLCLCCIDYDGKHIFGNIFESSIEELDEKRKLFREQFPQGLCQTCNGRFL
jgi:MoaA/NifB/PqqE/SkfB family radical SAM enzyme